MAAAVVVGLIAAGAATYQGLETSRHGKIARKRQDVAQRQAEGSALSTKRKAEAAQRKATAEKPNVAAIIAGEQSSTLDPTILTSPRQRLGANSALGTVGVKK
jgi:hypothetical protein